MNFFFTKFLNHPKTSTTFRADRTVSCSVHESRSQRVRAGAWRTSYQNKYSSVLSVLLSTISTSQYYQFCSAHLQTQTPDRRNKSTLQSPGASLPVVCSTTTVIITEYSSAETAREEEITVLWFDIWCSTTCSFVKLCFLRNKKLWTPMTTWKKWEENVNP